MTSPLQTTMFNGVSEFYNGVATQSLRFNDDDNAYLSKTFGSGSQRTWTWSGWVKRNNITDHGDFLYSQVTSGSDTSWFYFNASDQLNMQNYEGSNQVDIKTNAKFRDVSSWYHVMAVLDTTQGTNTDRAKMYVNGELQTSLASSTYPSQNADLKIGSGDAPFLIGGSPDGYGTGADYKSDMYYAEVNFVDGIALDPTYFGETKGGVWIPKQYTGSYGTNGFRLQFKQTGTGTASASTIGADTSGNTNHLTSTNLVASDSNIPDSPENNWSTLNSTYKTDNNQPTFSEGNLKVTPSQVAYQNTFSTIGVSSGKWYAEVRQDGATNSANYVGVADTEQFDHLQSTSYYIGSSSGSGTSYAMSMNSGNKFVEGNQGSYGSRTTDGQVIGIALDLDNGKIYFSVDGTYVNSGNPANGTNFMAENIASSTYHFGITVYTNGISSAVWNFGQDSTFAGQESAGGNTDENGVGDFHTAPPTGFLALCSANLPEPTIGPNSTTQNTDNFNTVLYTGNGGTLSVTGFDHQPDWLWVKSRNITGNHRLQDSSRGVSFSVIAQAEDGEKGDSDAEDIDSFDTDGFTVTQATYDDYNDANDTYVAWSWKLNGGTTSTNNDGSLTSTVQANQNSGVSIILYTGGGSAGDTIGHGLSAAPTMVWFKRRDANGNWMVYVKSMGGDGYINLDRTNGKDTGGSPVNNTDPSSSVITLGSFQSLNNNTNSYIAYAFHSVEGFTKVGSYTGNGDANGPFVHTGFSPAWIIIKRTDAAEDWWIYDNKRNGFNPHTQIIYANTNSAELTGTGDNISNDFVSNGIKFRTANVNWNANGGTYIYMAFAEAPFKYANAR